MGQTLGRGIFFLLGGACSAVFFLFLFKVRFAKIARLDGLDQAKGDFLATISHELKNPLAALKEGLSLLAAQGEELSPSGRARAFSACLIASKRLEAMLNNLLRLSRGDGSGMRHDFAVGDIAEALQMAMDEVRPLAEKKGMRIRSEPAPGLRACFNWDGMIQVFENLLLNAIKYGSDQTPIEVQTLVHGHSSQLEVSITNQGHGISEPEMDKIFDRFFRGENAKSKSGMGVGLHVVREIVETHGGTVHVASTDGVTRFSVLLPSAQR